MANAVLPAPPPRPPRPRPDRPSYQQHRREFQRHILLPLALTLLLGLGLGGLAIYGAATGGEAVSLWADIALIGLLVPMMLLLLLKMVFLAALVYGLARLLGIAPQYTGLAQSYALWLNARITHQIDRLIQPYLNLKAWMGILSKRKE